MFSKTKPELINRRKHDLSQFGLTEIPDKFDPSLGIDDENDSDLEAELAAITGGRSNVKLKPKKNLNVVPNNELDKMIEESLRDIDSDDDEDDTENDSELLGQLQCMIDVEQVEENDKISESQNKSPEADSKSEVYIATTDLSKVEFLKHRIEMYKAAEENAKSAGETAKMRRYNRGLKTLDGLLRQANLGKTINVDDIPPEVSLKPTPVSGNNPHMRDDSSKTDVCHTLLPRETIQEETKSAEDAVSASLKINPLLEIMRARQQEYKVAALHSKRAGNSANALQFLKVVKQFDVVVKMCEDGQEVDLSDMPPPPDQFKEFMKNMQLPSVNTPELNTNESSLSVSESIKSAEHNIATETSVLEALKQRLIKYKLVEEAAKVEENASKVRRFGRIVKQYENAIKAYECGHPVDYDGLPVPPGFGPLPIENLTVSTLPKADSVPLTPPVVSAPSTTSDHSPSTVIQNKQPIPPKHIELTTRTSGNQQKNNLAEQQMKILLSLQKEFKLAALEAKKAGEIDQAKEYLKIYKGFDALLNAASSGLPVDLSTLPVPPSQRDALEASFALITTEECDPDDDISDIGVRIEEQLAKQLMMCKNTRDHHKAMGDIAGMNRFENLAITVQKDLDLVRYSKRSNLQLPKFHYEKRSFHIVHCNTDLTDNELEIVVVRGITYNVSNPKEVDTYVKIEFPLLNDEMFKAKTNLVKDSDTPDYNQHYKVDILRGNRQFQRIFKRHAVKFEVYSRGGFLRSDSLIGTVNVKLQPLETKCDIHDTFELVEGRKKIGGKLEIKLRVRNPILTKQMEHINEKWLVIDT